MKVRTVYNRIDRVIYEFDEGDIRDALMAKAKIHYEPGKRTEFELHVDDEYRTTAVITVVWEMPLEPPP